ncbi:aldo/keto reductase [Roseivivax sp. CAU 1761]
MPITWTSPDGSPVPPYAFGTMQFGGTADAAATRALFDAAREAGIRHFDTAWDYTDGRSETWLGRLAGPERAALFLATKIGNRPGTDARGLRAEFETCRARLGVAQVDLLYLHRWDPQVPLADRIAVLAEIQAAGGARHFGVSNFAAWQVMKAQGLAAAHGTRLDAVQPMLNLVKRQAEAEILPMCAAEGIVPVTYSPLGGGLLSGKYGAGGRGRLTEDPRYSARYREAAAHVASEALAEIAAEAGCHPAALAVAWLMHHPARPVPILSARSAAQLAPALAGLTLTLEAGMQRRLSGLYPPPPPATDRLEEV